MFSTVSERQRPFIGMRIRRGRRSVQAQDGCVRDWREMSRTAPISTRMDRGKNGCGGGGEWGWGRRGAGGRRCGGGGAIIGHTRHRHLLGWIFSSNHQNLGHV